MILETSAGNSTHAVHLYTRTVLINETLPQSIRTEGHVLVPYLAQLRLGEEGRLLHGKLGNSHLNTFQTSHIHPDPFRSL